MRKMKVVVKTRVKDDLEINKNSYNSEGRGDECEDHGEDEENKNSDQDEGKKTIKTKARANSSNN